MKNLFGWYQLEPAALAWETTPPAIQLLPGPPADPHTHALPDTVLSSVDAQAMTNGCCAARRSRWAPGHVVRERSSKCFARSRGRATKQGCILSCDPVEHVDLVQRMVEQTAQFK